MVHSKTHAVTTQYFFISASKHKRSLLSTNKVLPNTYAQNSYEANHLDRKVDSSCKDGIYGLYTRMK